MIKRRMIQGLLILALLCGAVLLAHPSAAWAMEGRGTQEAPYQISTAADLQEFASLVNNGQTTANAELTADIVLNTGLDQTKFAVNDNGVLTYNGSSDFSFDQWTPIGNDYGYRYTGTFDGKGHTISGLYIDSNAGYVGLFGCIGSGGTVQNLTLSNSYIRIIRSDINTYVGGICGENRGSIENCDNSGAVEGSGSVGGAASTANVGGICGCNDEGTITNCSNSGTVTGSDEVGGICGYNAEGRIENCSNSGAVTGSDYSYVGGICGLNSGSITNCSNSGTVTGSDEVGGICGRNYRGSIENCDNSGDVSGTYVGGICGWNTWGSITSCSNSGAVTGSDYSYVGGICGQNGSDGTIMNCYWLKTTDAGAGIGKESGISENVESKNTDQYASGEVAWLLNEQSPNGPWRQNLSGPDKDEFPTLDPTHGVVSSTGNGMYHNCERYDDNGFCTICGSYEPAVQDASGTYQISNAGQLYWFAELVNGGQTTANAVLTKNITINSNVLDDNGNLNKSAATTFTKWTPIGGNNPYTGTFDGAGYEISGLYIDSDAGYAGLFGYIGEGGTAKNLNLADSYIYNSYSTISTAYVGGICGWNDGGNITSCSNSGTVSGGSTIGTACVGGICGRNDGSIENCSNSGTVSGSITNGIACVGGICGGNDGSIENCSNSGTVSGSITNDIAYVGGICGRNANGSLITTCSNSGDVTGSGKGFVGGICGENYGSITNCSNIGPVSGSIAGVGGICGRNTWGSITSGTITNCSNSGDVTGSYAGGICGDNDGGTITNCYWLDSTAGAGIGNDSGGATQKSEDEYKSGEVAWLLNQWSGDGVLNGKVWAMGENGYPVLNGESDNIVVKLTFNANTGNAADNFIRYANAGAAFPSVESPAREGYIFADWNTAADGSGTSAPEIKLDADITLYAQWEKAVYTVTLHAKGGTINSGNVTNYTYGTETTLPTDVTRAGYTFAGWYNNEALEGDAVTAIPADATGDKTYWAKWTAKSYPSAPTTVSEETIDAIADAQPGETVTVDLSGGSTKLDKEVFETLAGKDVTLVIDLGDGVSWTVNGSDVPEDADFTDIDMGVTMNSDGIPVEVVNAITGERSSVQITLAHDGAFGFTMTLTAPLGAENAGLWANLYYFDEDANAMTFETAAPIGSDGSVSLALSHASQYAIVIDDHNHGIVTLPFTDVSEDDWFYDPVCYVYSQGLMTGTSATTFEPNTPLSRAMLVAVLHRLEGSPQASAGDFTDVAEGDWYAQAVNWAASVGVVNGMGDGTFQPNAAITREQMAAILRNYAEYKSLDVTASGDLANYSDAASVSDWAKDSVEWAVGSGLIGGYEDSTLRPQGTTTRAEVASVLQRYLEK